jgi:hypothetical protein
MSNMLRTGDRGFTYGEGDRGPVEGGLRRGCCIDIKLSISFRSSSSADSSDMSFLPAILKSAFAFDSY